MGNLPSILRLGLDNTGARAYPRGMASFETDLARYLAEYEADEARAEREDEMRSESSDYAVNGEDATLIPAYLIADAEVPHVWRRYGDDDPGRLVPGVYGMK